MPVIIQDTWTEEDDIDLLEYVDKNEMHVRFLSGKEILAEKSTDIDVLFADTSIVQEMISKDTPVCYPDTLSKFYNREIKVLRVKDLANVKKPYFVKPYKNNKNFEAHIVKTGDDYEFMLKDLEEHRVSEDDYVYWSNLVNFVNEYRLFIGRNQLYGMVESTHLLIDPSKARSVKPPDELIAEILELNTYEFCVIDVGLIVDDGKEK